MTEWWWWWGEGGGPLSLQINQLHRELMCCLYYESLPPAPPPQHCTPPASPNLPTSLPLTNRRKEKSLSSASCVPGSVCYTHLAAEGNCWAVVPGHQWCASSDIRRQHLSHYFKRSLAGRGIHQTHASVWPICNTSRPDRVAIQPSHTRKAWWFQIHCNARVIDAWQHHTQEVGCRLNTRALTKESNTTQALVPRSELGRLHINATF